MRYLLTIAAFLLAANAMAGIRHLWDAMPDSLLMNKNSATIIEEKDGFLSADVSAALNVQLKALKDQDNKIVICLVRTYAAPEKESVVETYDEQWQLQSIVSFSLADIVGPEKAVEFASLFEPLLISASLSSENDMLTLKLSDNYLSEDEKKTLKDVALQTNVKWNGKTFK